MCKKPIFLISFVLVLGLLLSIAQGADPSLVGWWKFDEGAGTTAYDSSIYGNDGTLQNGPQWVNGKLKTALQFDGVDDFVQVPHDPILTVDNEVTVMAWINTSRHGGPGTEGWQGILAKSNDPRSYSFYTESGGGLHFSTAGTGTVSSTQVPLNEWVHVCAMVSAGQHIYYINGQPAGTSGSGIVLPGAADTANLTIGRTQEGANRSFLGMIDDPRIYNRALTQEEVQEAMLGADLQQARNPNPADGAIDVSVEANLTWTRGESADEDEVYFGTDPCALTKVADIIVLPPNPPLYNPGDPNLVASTTYYWRVDEINDMKTITGDLWSFTTVRGEAQPEYPSDGALIKGDMVSGNISTNLEFLPGATTVEYTGYFSEDYSKVESRAEDANLGPPPYAQWPDFKYTYWAGNPGVPPIIDSLVRGTKYYWTVDCKDTKGNTYYGDIWEFAIYGYHAFAPSPPNEAVLVSPDVLLSWLPGFSAEDHDIYIGTSWEDVNNAEFDPFNPPPEFLDTRSEPNFQCSGLATYTKYYWRVDEVVGRSPPLFIPTEFYKGNVWCFTTGLPGGGLLGEYYHHTGEASPPGFETFVVERIDPVIDFGWGDGQPHPLVNADDFTVRWRGKVGVPYSGLITFYAATDDGVRLWVDDMTTPIIEIRSTADVP